MVGCHLIEARRLSKTLFFIQSRNFFEFFVIFIVSFLIFLALGAQKNISHAARNNFPTQQYHVEKSWLSSPTTDSKLISVVPELSTPIAQGVADDSAKGPKSRNDNSKPEVADKAEKQLWWKQYRSKALAWIESHPEYLLGIGLYFVWLGSVFILYFIFPVSLLIINQIFGHHTYKLPRWAGDISLPIRYLLIVGFFDYRPRVLDAWVRRHVETARRNFEEKPTVEYRSNYINIPVNIDGKIEEEFDFMDLRPALDKGISQILIYGEGGSGKTSLACQVAKSAMAQDPNLRLSDHLMLPILIEQDLDLEEINGGDPLAETVRRQLQLLVGRKNDITRELTKNLLQSKRILVIVDHLSEMRSITRKRIRYENRNFCANALLITSRIKEDLGGPTPTIIQPVRITGNRLASFMEAYLSKTGKRTYFNDTEFFETCGRLSNMVGDRDITVLFAKMFADQAAAAVTGISDPELPDNLPDLMLSYLNRVNDSVQGEKLTNLQVHRDMKRIAFDCVKHSFRPEAENVESILNTMGGDDAELRLIYLQKRLRVVQSIEPGDRIRCVPDPLAEYLCGIQILEANSDNLDSWNELFRLVDEQPGTPESIRGFLLALRDCCIAKLKESPLRNFLDDELATRIGQDLKALVRTKVEQRITSAIDQLSATEPEEREFAARILGQMGERANEGVFALTKALKDPSASVRRAATEALGCMGASTESAIIPISKILNDQDPDARYVAAKALGKIGPAAATYMSQALKCPDANVRKLIVEALGNLEPLSTEIIDSLVDTLEDENSTVRRQAVEALTGAGDTAVPHLRKKLLNESPTVRCNAAAALGNIGPSAKAAVPDLVEVLKYDAPVARKFAAEALGKIGAPAELACDSLTTLLKHDDPVLREAAAKALGKICKDEQDIIDALHVVVRMDEDTYVRRYASDALANIALHSPI